LGEVHLPVIQGSGEGGFKVAERCYISREGLERLLEGGLPQNGDVKSTENFWKNEPRIGLERRAETRTAREGYLYYAVHVRPMKGVSLVVYVKGIPTHWKVAGVRAVPLGGEGRVARAEVGEGLPEEILPQFPRISPDGDGKLRYFVALITPGWFDPLEGVLKQGPREIPGTMISACIGKLDYIGGWDMEKGEPKPLIPLIPPGSLWFYEAENREFLGELQKLHGQCLGPKKNLGFSQIIIGRWEKER